MTRNQELKKRILETGRLTQEQLAQAEDYALTMNLPLDESIVFLQLMDYSELGELLEKIYNTPYSPLLEKRPSEELKKIIPLSLAEKFTIFPVQYDVQGHAITIAIDDPTDEDKKEQLAHILPPSNSLAFTVASRPEINRAIDIHYKGKNYIHEIRVELPKEFTIVTPKEEETSQRKETSGRKKVIIVEPDLGRFRALKTLLTIEGVETLGWAQGPEELIKISDAQNADLVLVNGEAYRPDESRIKELHFEADLPSISYYYPRNMLLGREPSYRAMGEALISLVGFLIKKTLKKDPITMKRTLTLVRYCKLVSLKMGLLPAQIDAVVLAAWLSTSALGSILAKNIDTPYGLGEILAKDLDERGKQRIERQILWLVKEYLDITESHPEKVRDIDGIRKTIGPRYKTGQRRIVFETFVQVIRDEGLLEGIGKEKGSVLIVGETMEPDSELVVRLKSEGYRVQVLETSHQAIGYIFQSPPDIILCDIAPYDKEPIKLCKAVRENPDTSNTPFFFVANKNGEHLATECLEIGADDFLVRPVDPDLLTLKVGRAISSRVQRPSTKGIEGSLAEMNAMDIIQSVATGEKNVKITLESNGIKGRIFIKAGEIIHAEVGVLSGEKALFQLMGLHEGQFQVVSCSSFPQRTIYGSTMSLLMEGARLVDEANATDEMEDL